MRRVLRYPVPVTVPPLPGLDEPSGPGRMAMGARESTYAPWRDAQEGCCPDDQDPGRRCLAAPPRRPGTCAPQPCALFPGARGQVYRALVIGTRVHTPDTTHVLRSVRRPTSAPAWNPPGHRVPPGQHHPRPARRLSSPLRGVATLA